MAFVSPLLSTIGLVCDILGAWFVAWELVAQFRGEEFESYSLIAEIKITATKSKSWLDWEMKRRTKMWCGLVLLTIGFILQMVAVWLPE